MINWPYALPCHTYPSGFKLKNGFCGWSAPGGKNNPGQGHSLQTLPFSRSLPRAILKPPKVYFFDNGDTLGDEGARFENLVAASLIKRLHFLEDRDGYRYVLHYLRDKEGREVDFVILKENQIEELIEVKFSDEKISRSLLYYAKRLQPNKATQIVAHLKRPYDQGNIRVTDPFSYFTPGFYD